MYKWIFILKLLGTDHDTGEIEWHEAVRSTPVSFQVCIENLVDTVNTLQDAGIQHDVYCEKVMVIKVEKFIVNPEKDDK